LPALEREMSFGSPWLLVALLAVPATAAAYLLHERRRLERAAVWGSPALLPNLVPRDPGVRRHVPFALLLLAVALLLVALARPRATFSATRQEAAVVLAIDTSRSMQAKDVKPTRIAAARVAAEAFLKELPSKVKVGVVGFSEQPAVLVPATSRRDLVTAAFARLRGGEGTDIASAITRSVAVARAAFPGKAEQGQRPPAAVLLLSDGAQTQGQTTPAAAARAARAKGVPVYTVSLGTPMGVVERKLQGGFIERVRVPPDPEALQGVAQASGGRFFQARDAQTLKRVYQDLGTRLGHRRETREMSVAAAGIGGLLALAAAGLSALWFRRLV
jgi:Ca-activated chloride channel family protein